MYLLIKPNVFIPARNSGTWMSNSRFNILFSNACSVFYLHEQMTLYLKSVGVSNGLQRSILFDIQVPEFLAGVWLQWNIFQSLSFLKICYICFKVSLKTTLFITTTSHTKTLCCCPYKSACTRLINSKHFFKRGDFIIKNLERNKDQISKGHFSSLSTNTYRPI
jgi:hypothetical protein